jgi:anti-sigma regulatory factor (Ser/Thr protein kinase)
MNAIEHGTHSDPRQFIEVDWIRTRRAVLCLVRDPGGGFSRALLPHAAVSNPPDSAIDHIEERIRRGLRPGGFGILMAQNLVDELVYNEKGNEALLVKYR